MTRILAEYLLSPTLPTHSMCSLQALCGRHDTIRLSILVFEQMSVTLRRIVREVEDANLIV